MASSRRIFAFDLETFLIGACVTAPPIVCLTYAVAEPGTNILDVVTECHGVRTEKAVLQADAFGGPISFGILGPADGLDRLAAELARTDTVVVGHNVPFDLHCAEQERPGLRDLIIAALENGRVADTQVRDQLIDIATGQYRCRTDEDPETGEVTFRSVGYHLADLAQRRLELTLAKGEDTWRLRYAELANVPLAQWPTEATTYAQLDALVTLGCYISQSDQWDPIPDEARQTKAAWALSAVAGRGICVDPSAVTALASALATDVLAAKAGLAGTGIYRPDGTKDMATLRTLVTTAYQARGETAPATKQGAIQTSRQVLLDSKDSTLKAFADYGAKEKLLTSFVPVLRSGFQAPIVCRYHTLVETGRTSCVGPNLQQLPRYPGVRDCFVPRRGYYLCSVDYDTLELRTLAQVCLDLVGFSEMATLLRKDPEYDLHSDFAANFMGIPYPEFRAQLAGERGDSAKAAAKRARQQAKAANFGYPGGLGAVKFKEYARTTYQLDLDLHTCELLKSAWKRRWPEVVEFQNLVSKSLDPTTNQADFPLVRTGFLRGECRYTQACNTQFQGLAAAGAKAALWDVTTTGHFFGVYPVAFLHDEILAEVPIATAHESAEWLAARMCDAMQTVVPSVPITAKPALMERWYKGAEPAYDAQGKLIPWRPKSESAA